MISLFLYVLATVLFVVAAFIGGVHLSEEHDLAYFGLAAFALAHAVPDLAKPSPR